MPKANSKLGVGAIVSARVSVLHPDKTFKEKYANSYKGATLNGLKITSGEQKATPKGGKLIVHMSHADFPDLDIWAFAGAVRLVTEGPAPYFAAAGAPPAPAGMEIAIVFSCAPGGVDHRLCAHNSHNFHVEAPDKLLYC